MDKKQTTIFNSLIDKFGLPYKNVVFVQHRNLTEFKYFEIERINPNHKIKLFGRLKNNYHKHNRSKKLIEVGEIIIGFTTLLLNCNILLNHIDFISICFCMFFINCLLFYIFAKINLFEVLYSNVINKLRLNIQTNMVG